MNSALGQLKAFFQWLAMQPGYKSRLSYTDMEYFNLSEKEVRIATAKRQTPVPTIEQIKHVIASMPNSSLIEQRNRALESTFQDFSAIAPASPKAPTVGALPPASLQVVPPVEMTAVTRLLLKKAE